MRRGGSKLLPSAALLGEVAAMWALRFLRHG